MNEAYIATPGAGTFFVRLESREKGEMKGVFDSVTMPAPCHFDNLVTLILLIDSFLDQEEDDPSVELRQLDTSFVPTFELTIPFRQHHTWQGSIRFHNNEKHMQFRSVLELLTILETEYGE